MLSTLSSAERLEEKASDSGRLGYLQYVFKDPFYKYYCRSRRTLAHAFPVVAEIHH